MGPRLPAATDPVLSAPPRPHFATLPVGVRREIDRRLGSPVVRATTARGGFSPSVAARLVTADGRRAFAKAARSDTPTAEQHRREAAVTAALPAGAATSRLLDGGEIGDHVVLLLADVEGAMPHHPWAAADLAATHATLDALAGLLSPPPPAPVGPVAGELRADLAAWSRLADQRTAATPGWVGRNLGRLVELCAGPAEDLFDGDTLLHLDIRADNLLLTAESSTGVVVLDWAWAAIGPAWVDRVGLAVDVGVGGGDPAAALAACAAGRAADPTAVTMLLAGLAGMWTEVVGRPLAAGTPALRGIQRAELDATLRWLRVRTGWA